MSAVHAVIALFALFMLVRHGPRAIALVRGRGPRTAGIVSLVNVILAAVILAAAVKGIVDGLISP
jgi:hypothetical protein